MPNYVIYTGDELYHYGVPGMKWGVIRSRYKARSIERQQRKALNYDKKSAVLTKKSEKAHATIDLGRSNRAAVKSANYAKKAAKYEKKALKANNDLKRSLYEAKAAKAEYKSAKAKMDANRLSKTAAYGTKAMNYSVKADRAAKRAAKARMKIANDKRYIEKMKQKASSLTKEELAGAYSFVDELFKN